MGLSDLPLASAQKHVKVFVKLGWVVKREAEHITLTNENVPFTTLCIPSHKEVRRGTLQAQVRRAGLTDRDYKSLFDILS